MYTICQKHNIVKILLKFEFLFKGLASKEKVATNYKKNHLNKFSWNQRTHGSESGYGWMFSQISYL
jgi:hypothetical protein